MEKVYISGKISNLENGIARGRFAVAEEILHQHGYCTYNPTRNWLSRCHWLYRLVGYTLTLLYDLWQLSRCQRIYLIPGWESSRGACIESFFAFKMKVRRIPLTEREEIDKEFHKLLIKKEKKS